MERAQPRRPFAGQLVGSNVEFLEDGVGVCELESSVAPSGYDAGPLNVRGEQ